jgi:L-cysteine desulfidase
MAWHYRGASNEEGLAGMTMERTALNVSVLNKLGMKDVDRVIIDIMEDRLGK